MKSVYVPFSANFAENRSNRFLSCFDMAEEKLDLRNISNSSIEQNRDESLVDRFDPFPTASKFKGDEERRYDRKRS